MPAAAHAPVPADPPPPEHAFATLEFLDPPCVWGEDPGEPHLHRGNEAPAYELVVGCRIRRDPAGDVDGPNLYRYVGNRPLLLTDPTGEFGIIHERPAEVEVEFPVVVAKLARDFNNLRRLPESRDITQEMTEAMNAAEGIWRRQASRYQVCTDDAVKSLSVRFSPVIFGRTYLEPQAFRSNPRPFSDPPPRAGANLALVGGTTDGSRPHAVVGGDALFLEVFSDPLPSFVNIIAGPTEAHEVGHSLGLGHAPSGLMGDNPTMGSSVSRGEFQRILNFWSRGLNRDFTVLGQ